MKRLKRGDTIGIFSPSCPITADVPSRHERSIAYLKSKGFNVLEGNLTGKSDYYRSGSIKERAQELNALIRNPKVRCIMSTIGGSNSNALLPYIDYEAFKKDPKIVIGYSDVTAILFALYAKTDIQTFYGPASVASFGEFPPFVDWTYDYFEQVLVKEGSYPYKCPTPAYWTDEMIDWASQDRSKATYDNNVKTIYGGCVEGRLIAGNLNTMTGFFGTPYMPEIKEGDILLIEDSLKTAEIIEKTFNLLKLSGVFYKIAGLILGKHELFDDQATGRKPYEILLEILDGQELPFIADFDCAHTHPMLTLPIGSRVRLDADKKILSIIEDPFK